MTRYITGLLAAFILGVSLSGVAVAVTDSDSGSVQSYSAAQRLDIGTVVELGDANTVTVATQKNLDNMFGVVIDPNQLSMTVSDASRKHQTYVASSGTYNALVSTQNGAIKKGDYVTLSSLDGVLMRAGTKQKTVFGRAAGSFSGNNVTLGSTTLKDANGNRHKKVKLGLSPVTIRIERNPNIISTKANVPKFLETLGQQIAQKKVSPIRIYLSLAITAVSLITAIIVLYAGVRNSVISIGRNPMSKKSIFRALLEIILTSVAVLIIGLFAVYLLLRL